MTRRSSRDDRLSITPAGYTVLVAAPNQLTAGAALLTAARRYAGIPYLYGVHDCSWLTETSALDVQIVLPRTSETQVELYPIRDQVAYEEGDLIFIEGDPIDANPGHVMIYVSPGQVFEAEMTGTLIGQKPFDTTQYEYRTRPALAHPLPTTIAKQGVVAVTASQARRAVANGWKRRYWNGSTFGTTPPNPLRTTTIYVNVGFRTRRSGPGPRPA